MAYIHTKGTNSTPRLRSDATLDSGKTQWKMPANLPEAWSDVVEMAISTLQPRSRNQLTINYTVGDLEDRTRGDERFVQDLPLEAMEFPESPGKPPESSVTQLTRLVTGDQLTRSSLPGELLRVVYKLSP